MMRPNSAPDQMDLRIIAELRRDGRLANTEIARRLGVSEATIRNRIRRLTKEGIIQIAAIVSLPSLDYRLNVLIGVSCQPGRMLDVGHQLTKIEDVRYVSCVTGRYDLLVGTFFRSEDDLLSFLANRLGTVPGIVKTETMHVARVLRRDYDYWQWTLVAAGVSAQAGDGEAVSVPEQRRDGAGTEGRGAHDTRPAEPPPDGIALGVSAAQTAQQ